MILEGTIQPAVTSGVKIESALPLPTSILPAEKKSDSILLANSTPPTAIEPAIEHKGAILPALETYTEKKGKPSQVSKDELAAEADKASTDQELRSILNRATKLESLAERTMVFSLLKGQVRLIRQRLVDGNINASTYFSDQETKLTTKDAIAAADTFFNIVEVEASQLSEYAENLQFAPRKDEQAISSVALQTNRDNFISIDGSILECNDWNNGQAVLVLFPYAGMGSGGIISGFRVSIMPGNNIDGRAIFGPFYKASQVLATESIDSPQYGNDSAYVSSEDVIAVGKIRMIVKKEGENFVLKRYADKVG